MFSRPESSQLLLDRTGSCALSHLTPLPYKWEQYLGTKAVMGNLRRHINISLAILFSQRLTDSSTEIVPKLILIIFFNLHRRLSLPLPAVNQSERSPSLLPRALSSL